MMNEPPDPSPTAPPLWTWRFARILLAQTTFGFGWSLYLLTPKFYTNQLGASPETVGHLSAMGGLFAVATIGVVASRIDRHGRRPLFQAGALVLSALSLGYLAVEQLGPALFLFHGLIGSAFVLSFNAAATLASDEAPPERMGQALGMLGASNMVMNGISTVIAERLAESVGWNAVFSLGIGAGLLAFALSFGMRESRRPPPAPALDAQPATEIAAAAWPLLAALLMGSAFSAIFVFYQPYALALGARELRGFFVGYTATAVLVRVVFGSVGDRYGRRRVSAVAACLYAASAASLIDLQPSYLLAYGALFGVAHGVLYPTLNALALERVAHGARGRAMTFYNGAFNAGMGASNLMWGALAEHRGYASVFVGAALMALLCGGVLLVRPRPRSLPAVAGDPPSADLA